LALSAKGGVTRARNGSGPALPQGFAVGVRSCVDGLRWRIASRTPAAHRLTFEATAAPHALPPGIGPATRRHANGTLA
jgi:hypothetical protein